jgi:hypothetical protein
MDKWTQDHKIIENRLILLVFYYTTGYSVDAKQQD